ncbi:MAG: hypothetical protein AAGA53_12740 [Pseudomonadota bacterium]
MFKYKNLSYVLIGSTVLLTGCQQYVERHEGVTTHAGNHLAANEAKMVVDPWNRDAYNSHIEGDGKRLGDAVKRYKNANDEESAKGQETIVLPVLPGSETK